jgi:hypothetical protein
MVASYKLNKILFLASVRKTGPYTIVLISKDGLSGSILFAGDYVKRKAEYYGFMTQQFRLELK